MAITIKTRYIVYNHNGTGVRHHHYTDQNTVHDFPDQQAGVNEPGNRIASGPAQYQFNGTDLQFAFMSITGTRSGSALHTTPGDYYYNVGTTDINILVVYAPASGIGGPKGEPGIWVDAFNVDTGQLSDDLHFISVSLPPATTPDATKTNLANQEGYIISDVPAHIKASATIDSNVPFIKWKQIIPASSEQTSPEFDLAKGDEGKIWIAFYKSSEHTPISISMRDNYYAIWQWVDYATMVDGHGGPGDPGPNLGVEVRQFAVGVALAKTAGQVNAELKGDLLNLAGKQIQLANEAIQKKIDESKR